MPNRVRTQGTTKNRKESNCAWPNDKVASFMQTSIFSHSANLFSAPAFDTRVRLCQRFRNRVRERGNLKKDFLLPHLIWNIPRLSKQSWASGGNCSKVFAIPFEFSEFNFFSFLFFSSSFLFPILNWVWRVEEKSFALLKSPVRLRC